MSASGEWKQLSLLENDLLAKTKNQLIHAIQPIVAVGRKFLPESPTDFNATLVWVPGLTRLAGHWIEGSKWFRNSICLLDFMIYLVDRKVNVISEFVLNERTQKENFIWLEEQIGKLGLDASDLTIDVPYKLPEHSVQKGDSFHVDHETLRIFSRYFHNSYLTLKTLGKTLGIDPLLVTVNPSNLVISTEIIIKETGDHSTNCKLTLGMCPSDDEFPSPYFFIRTWPHVMEEGVLSQLPKGAFWHEAFWTGAILPLQVLVQSDNQEELLYQFFEQSFLALRAHLLA